MTADATTPLDGERLFTQLVYREDGSVGRITLARPQVRNALSMRLSEELLRAIELARESRSLQMLVIDGAGETFCAGDDITEMPGWATPTMLCVVSAPTSGWRMRSRISTRSRLPPSTGMPSAVASRSRWHAISSSQPSEHAGECPRWTRGSHPVGRHDPPVTAGRPAHVQGDQPDRGFVPCAPSRGAGAVEPCRRRCDLDEEVTRLCEVLGSKNQQALRQLKVIIDRGAEGDLHAAQGFELLSQGSARPSTAPGRSTTATAARESRSSPRRAISGAIAVRWRGISGRADTPPAVHRTWTPRVGGAPRSRATRSRRGDGAADRGIQLRP